MLVREVESSGSEANPIALDAIIRASEKHLIGLRGHSGCARRETVGQMATRFGEPAAKTAGAKAATTSRSQLHVQSDQQRGKTQLPGGNDGKDTAGSKGGTVSNDFIGNVTHVAGDAAIDNNFGERRPPESVAGIPTLSEWGLILLSILLTLLTLLAWQEVSLQRPR